MDCMTVTHIFLNVNCNGKPIIYQIIRQYFDAEILSCKKYFSNFRYNSIINFLALTLTMSRHAVKVSNQQEGADEYGCVHSLH